MRTTISIQEDLLKKTQKLTGRAGYSDAIVTSLRDYVALKERLAYLKKLFTTPPSHSFRSIKKQRRKNKWS
ncbi:MAG: type II toxin-antitoxin system VapB family antitoxin [Deltaproteobacteria bacterium]|nr:type II toxin-antitoxin system VapB family antitoxin [Deltaproteobacteria bacterium]